MSRNIGKFIVLLISVVLILIPMSLIAFATEDSPEPLVVDLSASSSTRYVFDPENNHTDSYIVTGSNSNAEIIVNSSCNITLRNAAFRRIEVDYSDSYDINITLEGTNTIDQYNVASQAALGIYSSDVTICGGANDSLYANSKAFTAYSSSDELGVLTVEGGNITFRSFGGGAPFQTNYIQNGGNVTVIEEDYSESFLYDVQLNGGSLEVINKRASSGAVFIGDVKLKNGVSLKVSVPNAPYLVSGLIGLKDDAATDDCMFVRFDDSSEFIYLNDDNSELSGKNYAEIKVIEHTHACVDGVCSCGFICEHDTDGGNCGICGKYIYKIIHQPTDNEPYVTLNNGTNAAYKWYKMNCTQITDKSDILSWRYFDAPFADTYSYSKSGGWTGIPYGYIEEYGEQLIYYFVKSFSADEKILLEFSSPVLYAEMYSVEDYYVEFEISGNTASGIVENVGIYGLYVVTDGSIPTLKAYVINGGNTLLTDETAAGITAPEYGSCYFCEATANDGSVLFSSILDFSYRITHQPTETETYVALNNSENAKYQWYAVTENNEYITDENAVSFEIMGVPPEIGGLYSEENGWTPDAYGYYFVAELTEGQKLKLDFSEMPSEIYVLYSSVEGEVENDYQIYSDVLTADADGYYAICTEDVTVTLRAWIEDTIYEKIDGQTASCLTLNEKGCFMCEVTFKDSSTEISEVVEMTHIHTGGTATCMASAVCQVCSQSYGSINTEAHKWDNGTITTTATCKVIGVKTYTCQHNSKHTYTEDMTLDSSNHINTKNVAEIKATCITNGVTAGVYCNDCEVYISGCKETPKDTSNHINTKNVAEIKATCITNGATAGVYCNDCKTYISGYKELAKDTSNHVNTKKVSATPATTENAGYTEGVYCNDCKKYISGHKEIPVLSLAIGDIDGDGNITAADARLALRASVALENLDEVQKKAADADGDGNITAADARLILRASVGLEDPKKWKSK